MPNILQDLHKVPLLRVCIPLIIGIIAAHQLVLHSSNLWIAFVLLFVACFVAYFFFRHYRNRHLFPIFITCLFFVSGALLYELQKSKSKPIKINQHGHYLGYVSSLPQQKKKSVFVEFTICKSDSVELAKPVKTWMYFEKVISDSLLLPGKWLMINTTLKIPEKNPLPTEFDFYTYLVGQKVYYTAYVAFKNVHELQNNPKENLQILGLNIKKRVLDIFIANNIKGEELALLSALTIGYKKQIPAEQREAYAASGAMHVLAVSGLHVGIFYILFSYLFGFLRKLPFGNVWLTLVVILLMLGFAFITGFSSSVTRATFMFSFVAVGKLLRKQQYIINTIAASALVMLFIQPSHLFKIGFQLSYVAVIGIVLCYPILSEKWKVSGRIFKWLVGLILVSIIAQVITAPMNAFYFHRFANYSVMANLVVIPLVTVLLNLSVLLIFLGFLGIQFDLLGRLVNAIASVMNTSVYRISNIPGSTLESLYLTPIEVFVLYTILVSILIFAVYKNKWAIWLALSVLFLFAINKTIVKYNNQQSRQLLVYRDFGIPQLLLKGKDEGLVVYSNSPQSLLFCPVWFFENGISEEKVYAINYNENIELYDFILYRQFIGFGTNIFKIVDDLKRPVEPTRLQLSGVINLSNKSQWQVKVLDSLAVNAKNFTVSLNGYTHLDLRKE